MACEAFAAGAELHCHRGVRAADDRASDVRHICEGFLSRRGVRAQLIFGMVGGSAMFDLMTDESDRDYVGVFSMENDAFLGMGGDSVLDTITRTDEVPDSMAEPDHMMHEAAKFARLVAKGNYAAIELLYVESVPFFSTVHWQRLRAMRESFVTQKLVMQYIGYIKGAHRRICESEARARAANVKKFYHIFRVFFMIATIRAGRPLTISMPDGPEKSFVADIKGGKHDNWELAQRVTRQLAEVEAWFDAGIPLVHHTEPGPLNEWLLNVRHGR